MRILAVEGKVGGEVAGTAGVKLREGVAEVSFRGLPTFFLNADEGTELPPSIEEEGGTAGTGVCSAAWEGRGKRILRLPEQQGFSLSS